MAEMLLVLLGFYQKESVAVFAAVSVVLAVVVAFVAVALVVAVVADTMLDFAAAARLDLHVAAMLASAVEFSRVAHKSAFETPIVAGGTRAASYQTAVAKAAVLVCAHPQVLK